MKAEMQGQECSEERRRFLVKGGAISGAMLGTAVFGSVPGMAAAANAGAATVQATPAGNVSSDIVSMDAVTLSSAIKARKVSCRETMAAYLAHIERVNPKVNAIVALQDGDALLKQADARDSELARGEYRGWMHGMPHAVKDLAATTGIKTTYGSPLYKDNVPKHDDIFVERIKRQGAILIGKTNTPEFGLGSNTYNPVYGTTLNAYDQSRIAGGSSGGAAVSLALHLVPVADGSDMMGSLRNPAAFNNVYGFRPSAGCVPSGPSDELFLGELSTNGAMGRTVTDLATLLSTQAGYDPRAPLSIQQDPARFAAPLKRDFRGTRVGWLGDLNGYLPMEAGVLDLCRQSLKSFEAIGCRVEDTDLNFSPQRLWQTWLTMRHASVAASKGEAYKDPAKRALMKPELIWEIEGGLKLSAQDYFRASADRSAWYNAINALFARYDFLLLPTAQVFPFDAKTHWPASVAGKTMDTYHRWMEVVTPVSLSGSPAMSVPVGFGAQGLPMGVQIIGKRQADLAVLQLAYAYEQATQWVQRRPPALLGA
ncbi:amidase [Ralstonia sp. 24A2]|uniref:amidase n=1 Tax=Ralstonia sp. 24A2 TaxID=3447364 RepID=UPI003F69E4BF